MKKVILNVVLVASALFFTMSCADKRTADSDADSKEVAEDTNDEKFEDSDIEDDADFAVKAADAGMLEVELGKLAQNRGVSQQVKDLGKMMVTEHTKANEELKALAQSKNISLPMTLGEECQKDYDRIAEKSGEEFDEAFTEFMVKDHKEDIDAFKKQAEKGEDPDIKSWAAGKVATLEHHLDMAKAAEEAVENSRKNTGKL